MRCVFCEILEGSAPAHIVYEDEYSMAFLDINPISDGHTLLVPRVHVQWLEELPGGEWVELTQALKRLVPAVTKAVGARDSRIMINNGPKAGQIIPHLHIHIIPRTGLARRGVLGAVSRFKPRSKDYFEEVAQRIRGAVEELL